MSSLWATLLRSTILDNKAYEEWRKRPNLFLRGIVLILVVSLLAGLVSFAVNLATLSKPVNVAEIEEEMKRWFETQSQFYPGMQDPEVQEAMQAAMDQVVPMISDIASIRSPLPRGISALFQAVGGWMSRALAAIGGWLFYGALVLVVVNLLGGTAKLPEFLGMVSLYAIPGLLGLLNPVPCLGIILVLIGTVWSIAVYVKAVSFTTGLDIGPSLLAVFAPFLILVLIGLLVALALVFWIVLLF